MARKPRVEYEGAIYHVMSRGDRQEPIFKDDKDREIFLLTLAQVCEKTGWRVHALCLMLNHFHMVLETPQRNLVAGMKWFLGTYTGRFNRRHKLLGHLFAGRYKALVVDNSGNGYFRTVCDYVHLNPVRAKLIKKGQSLGTYEWSSFNDYLKGPGQRPAWLRVDRLFGEMGIAEDTVASRLRFEEEMEKRRAWEMGKEWREIRRGWCFGSNSFREGIMERMEGESDGKKKETERRRESVEEHGKRIIAEGLEKEGWKLEELSKRRKGDPVKVALALKLRQETTLSLKWVAEHLHMGTWEHLSRLLSKAVKGKMSLDHELTPKLFFDAFVD